jgi:hypothetical protein
MRIEAREIPGKEHPKRNCKAISRKSSFTAFKPTDNSVLGKDKGYREKETPAPQ